ncbi:MAG: hypothetical protein KF851_00170 [Pirellulaceae bacterium]|nr:hypothetical protein [Pirellulaceae bacterium]
MNQRTHELEKNELVEWSKKNLGFLGPHMRTILIAILGLAALSVGLSYYFQLQKQLAAGQWRQFHSAIYNMTQMQNASGLQMIQDEAPDSPVSHAAMLFAGDNFLRIGLQNMIRDYNAAVKDLKKAKDSLLTVVESKKAPEPQIEMRAIYLLAYTCESLGEFDDAKKYYTKLNERFPKSAFAKQGRRALERLADAQVRKIYDEFKTVGIAPGSNLPSRPDLSFPDLDDETTGEDALGNSAPETPSTENSTDDQTPPTQSESDG